MGNNNKKYTSHGQCHYFTGYVQIMFIILTYK